MSNDETRGDQAAVQALDDAWNDVYIRNERASFMDILADDFFGAFADLRMIRKANLLEPTPTAPAVSFSERSLHLFGPTCIVRGRIRVEHPQGIVEQRYFRVYSRRDGRWQAVAVQVFPVPGETSVTTHDSPRRTPT